MDGPRGIILSEVRLREISHNVSYMWNLKEKDTDELIYKTDPQTFKNKLTVTKGET